MRRPRFTLVEILVMGVVVALFGVVSIIVMTAGARVARGECPPWVLFYPHTSIIPGVCE